MTFEEFSQSLSGELVNEGLATENMSLHDVSEVDSAHLYETFDVNEMEMLHDIQDCIEQNEDLKVDTWEGLDVSEKETVLQNLENQIAQIEAREPMTISVENMVPGKCGYTDMQKGVIGISQSEVEDTSLSGLREVVDTVVHEGRHAYQYQNVYGVRTENNDAKYQGWVDNYRNGYLSAEMYGYDAYLNQPLEADAWAFADNVVSEISFR